MTVSEKKDNLCFDSPHVLHEVLHKLFPIYQETDEYAENQDPQTD